MNFIPSLFKSKLRRDCEKKFGFLTKIGFKEKYEFLGTESNLTYDNGKICLRLVWVIKEQNPWFLIKTETKEISLEDFEGELRDKYGFIKPGQEIFFNWAYNLMNRQEYLDLIKSKIQNLIYL